MVDSPRPAAPVRRRSRMIQRALLHYGGGTRRTGRSTVNPPRRRKVPDTSARPICSRWSRNLPGPAPRYLRSPTDGLLIATVPGPRMAVTRQGVAPGGAQRSREAGGGGVRRRAPGSGSPSTALWMGDRPGQECHPRTRCGMSVPGSADLALLPPQPARRGHEADQRPREQDQGRPRGKDRPLLKDLPEPVGEGGAGQELQHGRCLARQPRQR